MAKTSFSFAFKSDLNVVTDKVNANLDDIADALKERTVEWIQDKMLYGYHDPHGPDGHTEIVDTGATFDSVNAVIKRDSQNAYTVRAGVGTDYAVFVHNGTRKLKGRPFIRDTMIEKTDEIKRIMEDVGKGMD